MKIRRIIRNVAGVMFVFFVVTANTVGMWWMCLHSLHQDKFVVAIWLFFESILATYCFFRFFRELKDTYEEFDET